MRKESTNDKILQATIDLLKEQGYRATTTKAIAEKAGVNEVTIFRNFGSKDKIMEMIVQRHTFKMDNIRDYFTWELEVDLLHIGQYFLRQLTEMQDIISISFRDPTVFAELVKKISIQPNQFKQMLTDYFTKMKDKGKIADIDCVATAELFICLTTGYFFMRLSMCQSLITLNEQEIIHHTINTFIRGISPGTPSDCFARDLEKEEENL
ncbi:TetR/AcrR family transcriptional regulator [Brevibacterium sp. JNUCC-42]|uniref:TetR/AcrR family transcriptional regulator n=1 Tax=Brevibacillus laterosporus TaxID=1465 RepID=A0A502IR80_BRELA|nr:TetR/AcrR family transcriptional regulator [Brevibacillus laterosporus]QDX94263.1 TetR/AcrR family transcriptional regulator [Brevibacillus laterosporus]QOT00251.1 TetR/AcrR family transcriptional regulator [Brevibacterium sp. JNUCC-42]TPG68200.1 TetR/AcrR family transcriptional regulator [Brevibacillus laterosporus]TPG88673.1 TetR/AcrR family transcriptional regulator [Brevibacillus laterosporus]